MNTNTQYQEEQSTWYRAYAAHSQDFGEFDFINLLPIFNSRNHPLGVAVCYILFFLKTGNWRVK